MKKIIFTFTAFLLFFQLAQSQWILQNTGTTTDLRSIKFINRNTGWVCGTGVIAKTTNAGLNWVLQNHPATDKRLYCLSVVDSNVVYCVGMFKTILKTTNGGINWTAIQNGPYGTGDSYYSIFFIDKNTGWISGTGAKVWKTTTGGDSLSSVFIDGWINSIYFKDYSTGLICGDGGALFRTTNGGQNWYIPNIELHYMGHDFLDLSIVNNQYCWIIGLQSAPVYRSTDFGSNWDSVGKVAGSFEIYGVRFSNSNTGWCGGGGTPGGRMFRTTNSGFNWSRMDNDNNPGYIADIYFHNDSIGWASGNHGMVLYTTNGGVTFINEHSSTIPDKFILYQNYPNPFNGQTKIKIEIKDNGFYILEVFDLLGKKMENIFTSEKKTGIYQITLSSDKYPSGIYYYKLTKTDKISRDSQTKKFVVLK